MAKYVYRLGRWCVRHRRMVLLGWMAVLIGVGTLSVTLDTETSDAFTIPGTESQEAFDLLSERFPAVSGAHRRSSVRRPPSRISRGCGP